MLRIYRVVLEMIALLVLIAEEIEKRDAARGKQMREAGSRCGKRRVEIRTREKERKEIQG